MPSASSNGPAPAIADAKGAKGGRGGKGGKGGRGKGGRGNKGEAANGEKGADGGKGGVPVVKNAVQEAKKAMKVAADQILECRSWESLLANSDT
eukprot:s2428_g4.t1